ncbi:MAG TPA: Sec-independent protein translocase protein TatB [Stellaceae bacterium]|nr:Sec-independent protein translocase protein TatB [Stellaceae bacterium]
MFFDIGWSEFMVIGIVALIVIGPKDLPAALRVAGYWVRKARSLSREFHSSVEQMMREVELHEVQQELKKATELNIEHEFQKIVDPVTETTAATPSHEIPDYLDTSPAPLIPEEPGAPEAAAEPAAQIEEPELPLAMPMPAPLAEPEPARAAEPSKP